MAGGILFSFCALFLAAAKMERPFVSFIRPPILFFPLFLLRPKTKTAKEKEKWAVRKIEAEINMGRRRLSLAGADFSTAEFYFNFGALFLALGKNGAARHIFSAQQKRQQENRRPKILTAATIKIKRLMAGKR